MIRGRGLTSCVEGFSFSNCVYSACGRPSSCRTVRDVGSLCTKDAMVFIAIVNSVSSKRLTKRENSRTKTGRIDKDLLEQLWQVRVHQVPHTICASRHLHHSLNTSQCRSDWDSVVALDGFCHQLGQWAETYLQKVRNLARAAYCSIESRSRSIISLVQTMVTHLDGLDECIDAIGVAERCQSLRCAIYDRINETHGTCDILGVSTIPNLRPTLTRFSTVVLGMSKRSGMIPAPMI
jgi:hypothetical protein